MTSLELADAVAKLDWQLRRVALGMGFADPDSVKRAWAWLSEREAPPPKIQQWPGYLQIPAGIATPFSETYWPDMITERYFALPGHRVVCLRATGPVGWQLIRGDRIPSLDGFISV